MEEVPDSEKWTRVVIIDDMLGHLGWPSEINGVDWRKEIEHGPFDTLIRVEPWPEYGAVVRLAMKTRFTPEEEEAFDKRFEDDDPQDDGSTKPDVPSPTIIVIP